MKIATRSIILLVILDLVTGFAPKNARSTILSKASHSTTMDVLPVAMQHDIVTSASNMILSYSDDPVGDQLKGVNGAVLGAIFVSVAALGVGFNALIPKVGSASFTLTEEENDAILRVENGFDSKAWEQELTEQGTKGFVNRKRLAEEAKEKYQSTVASRREMKDKSLRYSEADLGFIACLLRASKPVPGFKIVDLGSGVGRSSVGLAAIYPSFSKVVGIEFLANLSKLSKSYASKVKGRKAPLEFKNADFAMEDLSSFDMAFVDGRYLNSAEVGAALSTIPSGAKVMTINLRLGSGYQLITTVDDPSGDLVLNTGYVFEKI